MSKVSSVNNPQNERLVIIREWQVRACEGDCCAAALLNFFIYWHDIKLDRQAKIKYQKPTYEISDNDLLQWHTSEALKQSLLDLYADKKIRKSIKLLEELGFISVHRNPKYKRDQTKFFLLNAEEINKWLQDNNYFFEKSLNNNSAQDNSMQQKDQIQLVKRPDANGQNVIDHPAKRLNGDGQKNRLQLVKRPDHYTENTYRDYKQKLLTKNNNKKINKNYLNKRFLTEQQRDEFLDEEYLRMREKYGNESWPESRCDEKIFSQFDAELREIEKRKDKY